MQYPISLTEFIEKQMTFYQIENNEKNFRKIYRKCQRTLISLGFWEKAETKLVVKSKTKVFNKNEIETLKKVTTEYFLKLSKFDKSILDKINENNYTNLFNNNKDDYSKLNKNHLNKSNITQDELLTAMITTLFEEKYTINIKLWEKDKRFCNKPCNVDNPVAQMEFINSNEYIIRNTRLSNIRNYIKKKP